MGQWDNEPIDRGRAVETAATQSNVRLLQNQLIAAILGAVETAATQSNVRLRGQGPIGVGRERCGEHFLRRHLVDNLDRFHAHRANATEQVDDVFLIVGKYASA